MVLRRRKVVKTMALALFLLLALFLSTLVSLVVVDVNPEEICASSTTIVVIIITQEVWLEKYMS